MTFGKDPELMKRRHEFIVKDKEGETVIREDGCVRAHLCAMTRPHVCVGMV